jgi:mycothiol system anti-sigma-R factor
MADCNQTLNELFTFLDGELADDTRSQLLEHLMVCTDCQGAFEFHHELKSAVSRKCRSDEMPAGLMEKIEACFGDDFAAGLDSAP